MKILGMVKTSTVDYPGKIVTTIFLGGCNLDCLFCHNPQLINPAPYDHQIEVYDILDHLKNRRHILEGLCISGGEATIHGEKLIRLVNLIKMEMGTGFLIKLDTNGTNSEFLEKYADKFDYIAMDYKCLKYSEVLGEFDNDIHRSLEILKNSQIEYEIRITVYPDYIKKEEFPLIAEELAGVKKVVLQQYKPVERGIKETYSPNELYDFKKILETKGIVSEIKC